MEDSVRRFYDDFAGSYHLIFSDWDASIDRQGEVLSRQIESALGPGPKRVLDCAAGIGTQAIALARRGHHVHASDLSPASIDRLRHEAAARDLGIETSVADLRDLDRDIPGRFDVVLACDNALPHLAPDQLAQGMRSMAAKIESGGLLIASIRDYDALLLERPRVTPLNVIDDRPGHRITFQVWDWAADGASYQVEQFILRKQEGEWRTSTFRTTYWPLRRDDLTRILRESGFTGVTWHDPSTSGFYQPLITARGPQL